MESDGNFNKAVSKQEENEITEKTLQTFCSVISKCKTVSEFVPADDLRFNLR